MDRIIEIKVNGSYLSKDSNVAGVQHEANAKVLRIEFDEGWDGYAKTATFWNALGEMPTKRVLTADLLEDLAANTRIYLCPIPGEAMTEDGEMKFVIDGYNGPMFVGNRPCLTASFKIEGTDSYTLCLKDYLLPEEHAEMVGKRLVMGGETYTIVAAGYKGDSEHTILTMDRTFTHPEEGARLFQPGGKRQRSEECWLKVKEGEIDLEAGESMDPTPTQAEQLQTQIEALLPTIQADKAAAQEAAAQAEASAADAASHALQAQETADAIAAEVQADVDRAQLAADEAEAQKTLAAAQAILAQEEADKAADSAESAEAAAKVAEECAARADQIAGGDFVTPTDMAKAKQEAIDEAQENLNVHATNKSNPHGVTAAQVGAASNHNLLDNWYFGNPVDQRGGYVVSPGVASYLDKGLTQSAGNTSGYRAVTATTSTYIAYTGSDGATYYCAPGTAVRGYTGEGYTIDRWRTHGNATVTIGSDSLAFFASGDANIVQPLENALKEDTLLTFSVLNKTGTLYARIRDAEWGDYGYAQVTGEGVATVTAVVPKGKIPMLQFYCGQGESVKVKAVKLELGTEQTLAHQENGNWVLNDPPPDKNMELLKCIQSTADASDMYANKVIYHTGNKPTPAGIGAVALDGSNAMTGPVKMGGDDAMLLRMDPVMDLAYKRMSLRFSQERMDQHGNISKAIILRDTGSGAEHELYTTGNKPTAADIQAGTLAGQVYANPTASATHNAFQVRNICAQDSDIVAGASALQSGYIVLVYE